MAGQAGSIAGSRFFSREDGPFYVKGMAISAGLLFFAVIMTLALRFLMSMENKRQDRIHGTVENADMANDASNAEHPSFRYML